MIFETVKAETSWNLASDQKLFEALQNFSKTISERVQNCIKNVDELNYEVSDSEVSLHNTFNDFLMLGDTQFIENRVYEDDEEEDNEEESTKIDIQPTVVDPVHAFRQALTFGKAALAIFKADSQIEDIYNSRPLPFVIGTKIFNESNDAGLGGIEQDEVEEEEEFETPIDTIDKENENENQEHEGSLESNKNIYPSAEPAIDNHHTPPAQGVKPPPPPPPRQVGVPEPPRYDNDDSQSESNSMSSEPVSQPSIKDLLNASIKSRNGPEIPTSNIPPLPTSSNIEDDDEEDEEGGDLFADQDDPYSLFTSKRKSSAIKTTAKKDALAELFGDIRERSDSTASSDSSLFGGTSSRPVSGLLGKSNFSNLFENDNDDNLFNDISKPDVKIPTATTTESLSKNITAEPKSITPVSIPQPIVPQNIVPIKIANKSDLFGDSDDLFSSKPESVPIIKSTLAPSASVTKSKFASLFGDDEDDGSSSLFGPKPSNNTSSNSQSAKKKASSLFDDDADEDDLFGSKKPLDSKAEKLTIGSNKAKRASIFDEDEDNSSLFGNKFDSKIAVNTKIEEDPKSSHLFENKSNVDDFVLSVKPIEPKQPEPSNNLQNPPSDDSKSLKTPIIKPNFKKKSIFDEDEEFGKEDERLFGETQPKPIEKRNESSEKPKAPVIINVPLAESSVPQTTDSNNSDVNKSSTIPKFQFPVPVRRNSAMSEESEDNDEDDWEASPKPISPHIPSFAPPIKTNTSDVMGGLFGSSSESKNPLFNIPEESPKPEVVANKKIEPEEIKTQEPALPSSKISSGLASRLAGLDTSKIVLPGMAPAPKPPIEKSSLFEESVDPIPSLPSSASSSLFGSSSSKPRDELFSDNSNGNLFNTNINRVTMSSNTKSRKAPTKKAFIVDSDPLFGNSKSTKGLFDDEDDLTIISNKKEPKSTAPSSLFDDSKPISRVPIENKPLSSSIKSSLFDEQDLNQTNILANNLFAAPKIKEKIFDEPIPSAPSTSQSSFFNNNQSQISPKEDPLISTNIAVKASNSLFDEPVFEKVQATSSKSSLFNNDDPLLSSQENSLLTSKGEASKISPQPKPSSIVLFEEKEPLLSLQKDQISKPSLFDEPVAVPPKKASNLFGDDDSLFSSKKDINTLSAKKTSLFGDDDDDVLFGSKKAPAQTSSSGIKPVKKSSLFGDDDDDDPLFGSSKKSTSTSKKGLFDD